MALHPLLIAGHGGGLLLTLHAASFAVWGVVLIVHVLAYVARTLQLGPADWHPKAERVVAGVRSRGAALAGSLLAGVLLAFATYPAQQGRLNHRRRHRHNDASGTRPLTTFRHSTPAQRQTGNGS